jgi:hypothetical protein
MEGDELISEDEDTMLNGKYLSLEARESCPHNDRQDDVV